MKTLLSILTFLFLSCGTTYNLIDSVPNKSYMGKVESIQKLDYGFGIGKSYYIKTDLESLILDQKTNLEIGDSIWIVEKNGGIDLYVIWKDAKELYKIR